jgi:O-antigen ligase
MSFLENCDILTFTLLSAIVLLIALFILFYSLKRYELAIVFILLSPWAHWIFTPGVHEGDIESAAPDFGTYMRVSIVVLVGIIGVFQFLKLRSGGRNGVPFYLLLLGGFVLYALLSTIYSIDKKYTFVRSSEFIFFFFFLLGFYYWLKDKTRLDKTLNIYFMIMTCGIIINIIALVLFPSRVWSWIMPDRFQGILEHPNTLGAFCMLSYPVLMWKYNSLSPIGKVLLLFLFCTVLFMHTLSGSRASLVTSILGFFLWYLIINRANLYSLAKILSLALIILSGVVLLLQYRPASLKREAADITNLTGRTEFWQGCIQLVKERPITGYGYGVGGKIWSDPRFYKAGQFLWSGSARASLHNGYLSMAIGLGFAGLLIWLSLILIPAWKVMRLEPCGHKALVVVILFQGMVLNCFETSIVSGSQIITSLVFWLFLVMAQRLPLLPSPDRANELPAVGFVPTRRRYYAA